MSLLALTFALGAAGGVTEAPALVQPLPLKAFQKIDRDSGRDNYYRLVTDGEGSRLAADYQPPMESETFGTQIPDALRKREIKLRWRWRVRTFPRGGDDCVKGRSDSAAGVFLTFHSGLKWILIKYIWSEGRPVGSSCDRRGSPFLSRETAVLESGGPTGLWRAEVIDPKGEYVRRFGVKREDVPDFVGVGVFTDGDQTQSPSAADYADFAIEVEPPRVP